MLSNLFMGFSLVGAEWVLAILVLLSILSVTLIIERYFFYHRASRGLEEFRKKFRGAAHRGNYSDALKIAEARLKKKGKGSADLETEMAIALLSHSSTSPEILTQVAQDKVILARLRWDKNLSILATIGSNAPFIGLFGTVLGIIKAFHDLTQPGHEEAQAVVSAGISEALVATAVGLLVAIPAVIAFNIYQKKVRSALAQAESLKSFLISERSSKAS